MKAAEGVRDGSVIPVRGGYPKVCRRIEIRFNPSSTIAYSILLLTCYSSSFIAVERFLEATEEDFQF